MSAPYPFVYLLQPHQPLLLYLNYPLYPIDFQPINSDISQSFQKQDPFFQKFYQQLKKTSSKYNKKVWTKDQDKQLLSLRKKCLRWTQISQKISQSNPQICKRRFKRLKAEEDKWPHEFEQEIKKVCAIKQLKWNKKMEILHTKFPQSVNYSKKKIKQRYLTYLDQQIEVKCWTVEEDLHLIKLIRGNSRKWKKIAKDFPGRTELHVKNRYYGCLRKIQSIVQEQMSKN